MDKLTQNILLIGGIGAAAWYLVSKNKDAKAGVKAPTIEKDAFGMPQIMPNILSGKAENRSNSVVAPNTPVMPHDVRVALDEAQRRTPPSTIKQEPSIKPSLGKYRFKEDRSDSKPITAFYNIVASTGTQPPRQIKTVIFKKGDVVNVKKLFWNISSGEYSALIPVDGMTFSFPLASLEKVDDSIAESVPKITTNTAGGMAYFSGRKPLTLDNLLG